MKGQSLMGCSSLYLYSLCFKMSSCIESKGWLRMHKFLMSENWFIYGRIGKLKTETMLMLYIRYFISKNFSGDLFELYILKKTETSQSFVLLK